MSSYDANPTVDSRDPDAWRRYAERLDNSVPRWWEDPVDIMNPHLAEQAQIRRRSERLARRRLTPSGINAGIERIVEGNMQPLIPDQLLPLTAHVIDAVEDALQHADTAGIGLAYTLDTDQLRATVCFLVGVASGAINALAQERGKPVGDLFTELRRGMAR